MFQIDIPKRSAACAHNGETLTPGMEYYSALMTSEDEEHLERRDFCPNCWEDLNKKKQLETASSTWKSVVPQKKHESELPKQRDDRAFYLLKEALASPEINANKDLQGEAFVLALYLARRRRIHLRPDLKRGNTPTTMLYEVDDTEEMLCVPRVALPQLQVETIQAAIAKKLNAK